MEQSVFGAFETVKYEGPQSASSLAYRWYDPTRVVMGKPLAEHMRFAIAYWHSLAMNGSDPFGAPTIMRPLDDRLGPDPVGERQSRRGVRSLPCPRTAVLHLS